MSKSYKAKLLYVASDSKYTKEFIHRFITALEKNFEVDVLNIVRENHLLCKRLGFNSIYLEQKSEFDLSKLSILEKRLKFNSTRVVQSYSAIYKMPLFMYKLYISHYLRSLEKIDLEQYIAAVSGLGTEPHKMLIELVFNRLNKKLYIHGESPIWEDRMFIYDGMNNKPVLNRVEDKDFYNNEKDPSEEKKYMIRGISLEGYKGISLHWLDIYRSLSLRFRYLHNYINRFIFQLFAVNEENIESIKGNLAFFPLHVNEDSQILYRNYMLRDQGAVVERLRNMLPKSSELIIKAHPGKNGSIPWCLLSKILRGKIKLLRTDVPAGRILEKFDFVFVINSTVAFEAIQKAVPFAYIGNWKVADACGFPYMDLNDPDSMDVMLRKKTNYSADKLLRSVYKFQHLGCLYRSNVNENDYEGFSESLKRVVNENEQ